MNAERMRTLAIFALCTLALGALGWYVSRFFEERWDSRVHQSDAAQHNRMLGATRLLEMNQHRVTNVPTLSVALFNPLPAGTLMLPDSGGTMLKEQVDKVLDWVAQGNTVITTPPWAPPLNYRSKDEDDDEKDEDAPKASKTSKSPKSSKSRATARSIDSIGMRFNISSTRGLSDGRVCRDPRLADNDDAQHKIVPGTPGTPVPPATGDNNDKSEHLEVIDCTTTITLPGTPHGVRIDGALGRLQSPTDPRNQETPENAAPATPDAASADAASAATPAAPLQILADERGSEVRVFQHGKGRVVFVARNFFDNDYLPRYDHAELLLGLANLNTAASPVMIVQRVDIASWPRLLWANIPYVLCGLALFLLLLLWSAVRRFGPMLPEPDDRRRSLIEHVDASGRWLWKTEIGRQILITALRTVTERALDRRAPELRKLGSDERIKKLAELCKVKPAQIEKALLDTPARVPAEFTQQIQTLQLLRKHYER